MYVKKMIFGFYLNGSSRMNKEKRSLFCFGMGKVASQLSLILQDKGWSIYGTCRRQDRKKELESKGFKIFIFPSDQIASDILIDLKKSTHILTSIPPDYEGCLAAKFYSKIIGDVIEKAWLGYISSTSVYGHHGEKWVNENTTPVTQSQIGRNRLIAENQWKKISKNYSYPLQIFRSGGIYDSTRNQIIRIKDNPKAKIIRDNQRFNRIHQDDLVGVILSTLKENKNINIFNVVDDTPTSVWEQVKYICDELSWPLPESVNLEDKDLTEKQREFYKEVKLVSNNLIKVKLGYKLEYPSYKEGLQAIIKKLKN